MEKEYRRYKLSYPFDGRKIYEASSKKAAVKKCYEEFKELDSMGYGIFSVVDLKSKKTYTYKVKKDKYDQTGGATKVLDGLKSQLKDLEKQLEDAEKRI